jgi:hypothetical protein
LSKFEVFDTGGELLAVASAQNYRSLRARCSYQRQSSG